MYPDDAQISRVFTRDVGATVEDETFTITANFEVVVEVEAGTTIFFNASTYFISVAVIDYSFDATAIPNITNPGGTGSGPFVGTQGPSAMNSAPWATQATQIVFTVHAADLAGRADHMCQAYAFLRVGGGAEPQASFATSPFFLLHA